MPSRMASMATQRIAFRVGLAVWSLMASEGLSFSLAGE